MGQQLEAFVIHDGHVILECDDAFCELFRCDCKEVIGMHMEKIISGDDLRTLAVWRGKHIMAEPEDKEFRQEYEFSRCDGTRFWGESFSWRIEPGKYRTAIKWHYDINKNYHWR